MTELQKKARARFQKIEKHLRNFKHYKAGISNLQKQLDYIMPGITASYEIRDGSIGTFLISSTTEEAAIDRIEGKRALALHEDIAIYKLVIESIEMAIEGLEEHEKKFVKCRYFESYSMDKTAQALGYTTRNIFNVRDNVRDKLMISLKNIINLEV